MPIHSYEGHSIMCSTTPHPTQQWSVPPKALDLQEGEVQVWRGIVDIPSAHLQVYWETLSGDEQQRARRFRFRQHQNRFIGARGMLRSLLSRYLDLSPHEIKFGLSPKGKPFVQNSPARKIYFNVSHSQKVALFAFSHHFEVGIDVEGTRFRLDYQGVAKRVLSPQEQQWLHSVPVSKQKSAFLACWTRKEAFAKAHGTGLAFPFRKITVTFLPHQPACLVHSEDPSLNGRTWTIHPVYPRARYTGALVVTGQPRAIRYWDYQQQESPSKVK